MYQSHKSTLSPLETPLTTKTFPTPSICDCSTRKWQAERGRNEAIWDVEIRLWQTSVEIVLNGLTQVGPYMVFFPPSYLARRWGGAARGENLKQRQTKRSLSIVKYIDIKFKFMTTNAGTKDKTTWKAREEIWFIIAWRLSVFITQTLRLCSYEPMHTYTHTHTLPYSGCLSNSIPLSFPASWWR